MTYDITHNLTQYDVQALIDDELDHENTKRVLNGLQQDKRLYAYYQNLKAQKQLLKEWWSIRKKI